MEGDKIKDRPWFTRSITLRKENISHDHNNGGIGSKERFILVKTGLPQDFHGICYILRTQNIGGGNKTPKETKKPPKIPKIQ